MLIDDFVYNYFEVVIGGLIFLFDVLNLSLEIHNALVFVAYIEELTLKAVLVLVRGENELAVVEGLRSIFKICLYLPLLVFLPH